MHLPMPSIAKLPCLWGAFLRVRAGGASRREPLDPVERCDRIRVRMLGQLQDCDGEQAAALRVRLRAAPDLRTLWHLRVRLMHLLASTRGETAGRLALEAIDACFREHWPQAPVSRAAPLR